MPRLGRPPATRGVWSFEDTAVSLPQTVLLDTSFVFEALSPPQPLHVPATNYLIRLATERIPVVYSAMLDLELAEVSFQVALKERVSRDWRGYRHDGRARRRASRLMAEVAAAWGETLRYLDDTRVDISSVEHEVTGLMTKFGLASYDAVHAATALRANVSAIVTLDAGFASIPRRVMGLVGDSSRLARCRQIRARG